MTIYINNRNFKIDICVKSIYNYLKYTKEGFIEIQKNQNIDISKNNINNEPSMIYISNENHPNKRKKRTCSEKRIKDFRIFLSRLISFLIINSIMLIYQLKSISFNILKKISLSYNFTKYIGLVTKELNCIDNKGDLQYKNSNKNKKTYLNLLINSRSNILLKLIFLIIFSSFIAKINSKGLCGNITNPKNVKECLPFSTQDDFCCLLTIDNSPSDFKTCYLVEKDTASSTVIQIGKITYKVDCTGIPDFYKYFPFEEKFKTCSTSNPKSISTCTDFLMDNNAKCCLGIIKSYPDIRKCYSSIGLIANRINYTTSYGDEISLFCSGGYLISLMGNLHKLLFYIVLFLFGLF
jgi:hypothetical protein